MNNILLETIYRGVYPEAIVLTVAIYRGALRELSFALSEISFSLSDISQHLRDISFPLREIYIQYGDILFSLSEISLSPSNISFVFNEIVRMYRSKGYVRLGLVSREDQAKTLNPPYRPYFNDNPYSACGEQTNRINFPDSKVYGSKTRLARCFRDYFTDRLITNQS